ncbi:hypothetical protein [Bradyrhizobium japonicum]|uniref:hypothetical protein n=1 Tax=Bradyrhizobium japonicum TaxID=375 RepID=UPI001B8A2F20|nr:hypothetical protein [Bradyrhizobium japonicum]MBR0973660.1 hypothetical protein [Bradyrhizobium japonicum]
MADSDNAAAAGPETAEETKRFRSELSFPYADLEGCVELAQTLFTRVGPAACDQGELAAWMNQSATGGTFRTRISAAKMFGLIDTGQGRASITQLGRDALTGTGNERSARVQAFLNPELFNRMYEQNKGHTLPPAAAIERQMEQMGISPKQKERARQTFVKSATYAGFIDISTGRFVKPGLSPQEERSAKRDEDLGGGGNGGGGGGQPPIDPIIAGLLARLPKSGEIWPETDRKLWLQLLEGSFKLIYKDSPPS